MIENNLAKSDLEKNPTRYKIITPVPNANEIQAELNSDTNNPIQAENTYNNMNNNNNKLNIEFKSNKTINENLFFQNSKKNSTSTFPYNSYHLDPYPYYGNTTNSIKYPKLYIKGPPTGIVFKDPMGRYGNFDIYEKDQAPYYGSIYEYRKISNIPYNKFLKVPIVIKDLDDFYNEKKIKNNLKEKDATKINKLDSLYLKDPKPYYDATFLDKQINKNRLEVIRQDKKNDLKFGTQKILLEKLKEEIKIQNYKNADKEENNKVNRVYYTDTSWYRHKKINVTYTNSTSAANKRNRSLEYAYAVRHDIVDVDVA